MKPWIKIIFLFTLSANHALAETCNDVPLIENSCFWGEYAGQATVNCSYSGCFPKDISAKIACDPRCLFTERGYGEPEPLVRAFVGKKPLARTVKPNFIVAFGPPSSGKSRILPVLEKNFHDTYGHASNTISINVEDIFQRGGIGDLYQKYRNQLIQTKKNDKQLKIYTQRLYTYFRWLADQISDAILNRALLDHYNVIWETTGNTTWHRREIARIHDYGFHTLVVYPLVNTEELIKRAQIREKEEGQEALNSEAIRSMVTNAQTNLIHLLPNASQEFQEDCKKNGETHELLKCNADTVILIDNTQLKGEETIVFNTNTPALNCEGLKKLDTEVHLLNELKYALKPYTKNCNL